MTCSIVHSLHTHFNYAAIIWQRKQRRLPLRSGASSELIPMPTMAVDQPFTRQQQGNCPIGCSLLLDFCLSKASLVSYLAHELST